MSGIHLRQRFGLCETLQCFPDFLYLYKSVQNASKPNRHAASEGILMTKLYRSTIFIPQILRCTLR